ncbi:MAG TPA: hypothetical protein VMY99_02900 [Nevskiaceae bacterium]|nr:hypothetical protein [Nevskiaceae bacterium]
MFEEWLERFVANIHRHSHQAAIQDSFNRLIEQFNIRKPRLVAPDSLVRRLLDQPKSDPGIMRNALILSEQRYKAADHPDLVLALAIYHAAHKPYLGGLVTALRRAHMHKEISTVEWQNACTVLDNPFDQFNDFIIYDTLLPLILLKREDILQANANLTPDEAMISAIPKGWQAFFENKLLRRNFTNGTIMNCPAFEHLHFAMRKRLLENIYTFIAAYRRTPLMSTLRAKARMASQEAVRNPIYHYSAFVARVVASEVGKDRNSRVNRGFYR